MNKPRSIIPAVLIVTLLAAGFYVIVTRTLYPPSAPTQPGSCSACGTAHAPFVLVDAVEETQQQLCPMCWVEWQEREGVPVWPETKGRQGNENVPRKDSGRR